VKFHKDNGEGREGGLLLFSLVSLFLNFTKRTARAERVGIGRFFCLLLFSLYSC